MAIGSFPANFILSVRKAIARLLGRSYIRIGRCNNCGSCCRLVSLFVDGRHVATDEDFADVCQVFPEYQRFYVAGLDPQGQPVFTCKYLNDRNYCTDYKNRPHICRKYPGPGIFLKGGRLMPGCGYQLIPVSDFGKMLSKKMEENESGEEDSATEQ